MKVNELFKKKLQQSVGQYQIPSGSRTSIRRTQLDKELLAWMVIDRRATFMYATGRRTIYAYQTSDEPFKNWGKFSLYEIPPEVALKRIQEKIGEGCDGDMDIEKIEVATKTALGESIVKVSIQSVTVMSQDDELSAEEVIEKRVRDYRSVYDVRDRGGQLIVLMKQWCRDDDSGRSRIATLSEVASFVGKYEKALSVVQAVAKVKEIRKEKGAEHYYEHVPVRESDLPDDILKRLTNMVVLQQL